MIYIIGNKDLNVCKIGFSQRPKRRITGIKSQLPFEIEIFSITDGSREDEKILHQKYAEHRIKGEWFVLSEVEENNIIFKKEEFLNGIILVNNGYYLLSSVLKILHKNSIQNDKPRFNISAFFNRDDIKILIDGMTDKFGDGVIDKGFGKWVHPLIFTEICRSHSAEAKLHAYEKLLERTTKK